ncbi:helix-turn-helix domain-containing protein [Sphingobacterium sp. DN00404]|uniref:Helix-turn-helix domain-containing protein n=1 Tax=Sphingobacterium micropteri TaxID=2763501 RepID=A0ABR7YKJ2_9SPHI|nr:helix-turn-helix domain-containing protein [Sphingobacterium micropteri]MBD1431779.1 helix-turn-helix domain-containing protein [Sphingobacterium micropteri]
MKKSKEYMKWRARTVAKILLTKHAVYKKVLTLLRKQLAAEEEIQLLSAKDVQTLFTIGHSTYYRWIKSGRLTPTIVNGRHYYRKEEIIALLEKRRYRNRGGF